MAFDRGEQLGHLEAEGDRNRLLQVASRDHRRVAVPLREIGERGRDGAQIVVDELERLAHLQHRRGVGNVLRGRAPVAVLAKLVAAQRVQLRDHTQDRIANALGLLLELAHVDLVDRAVLHDLVGRFLGDDAEATLDSCKRAFDVQIPLRPVLVGPHVAHGLGAEDVAEDGGVDDGGRHGGGFRCEEWMRAAFGFRHHARARMRIAFAITGRSTILPSS